MSDATSTATTEPDPVAQNFALAEEVPVFVTFFKELGVPTLRATLDHPDGVLGVISAEDADVYCRFAAIVEADGDPAARLLARLVSFTADCLLNTIARDSEVCRLDDDGTPHLHFDGLPPIEITAEKLRHWQWLLALIVIRDAPTHLLDSMPPAMRERAREHARSTAQSRADSLTFFELTKGLGL